MRVTLSVQSFYHLKRWAQRSELGVPGYLGQVVSSKRGITCHLPGHVQGDDVSHSLHLMDDGVGVGQGLPSSYTWQL